MTSSILAQHILSLPRWSIKCKLPPAKESQIFSITFKYLKDAELVISLMFQFKRPVWPIQKMVSPSQMAMDSYKQNQMVVLLIIRAADGLSTGTN